MCGLCPLRTTNAPERSNKQRAPSCRRKPLVAPQACATPPHTPLQWRRIYAEAPVFGNSSPPLATNSDCQRTTLVPICRLKPVRRGTHSHCAMHGHGAPRPPNIPLANQLRPYAVKFMSGNNDGMSLLRHIADRHETPRQSPPRTHNCAAQSKRIHQIGGLGGSCRPPPAPEAKRPQQTAADICLRSLNPAQTPKHDKLHRHMLLATSGRLAGALADNPAPPACNEACALN